LLHKTLLLLAVEYVALANYVDSWRGFFCSFRSGSEYSLWS